MARRVVLGLMLVALAFVPRSDAVPADRAVPRLGPRMDSRAQLVGHLLRILVLAFALWVAIEMLDLRGPDPDVPRHVLNEPAEHDLGPRGCAPFC